ncbi:hypothetical protein CHARACLAT_031741 [Characodon lateralis]|uniref:Uncharacterized protein n=1 Tax=Characodon lateralis TaxID=208331 RepID=A0ABU7DVU8_9TELE|nr:hypothetical protein [Characodon lateralis]
MGSNVSVSGGGSTRESSSGSVIHTGERTMPVVVLTEPTRGSTGRSGRLCSQTVAKKPPLRFSSISADPTAPGSSPRGVSLRSVILVAPDRKGAPRFPSQQQLVSSRLWREDAIFQAGGAIRSVPEIGQRLGSLAAERVRLERLNLLHNVVRPI